MEPDEAGRDCGTILVTSAAGLSGRLVSASLRRRGIKVRGLVRNDQQASTVSASGIEPFIGNPLADRDLSFACSEIDAIYHICPKLVDYEVELGKKIISVAKAKGLKRIIYQSVAHPYIVDMPHHRDKLQVQILLEQSDVPYAIIQPSNYMQNIMWAWGELLERGRYELPYSADARLTWVDAEDVAEAGAVVALDSKYMYGAYELCGTNEPISRREICAILSTKLGRTVVAGTRTWEEWRELPRYRNWSPEQLRRLLMMFNYYNRHGFRAGNRQILQLILGRAPRDYGEFLERALANV